MWQRKLGSYFVLTKYVPQVADLEIVEADFESKNNSLSSDLFLMAGLKTAKNKIFNTFLKTFLALTNLIFQDNLTKIDYRGNF